MTQILTARADKEAVFDEFERITARHLIVGLTPETAAKVKEHFAKLRADPRPINVAMRLETFPEFEKTRIILDISPQGIPSIPEIRQDH